MDYGEMTHSSKSFIKRFTHTKRYSIGLGLCNKASSVFDYGTGSGHFLRLLSEQRPDLMLVGFEPLDRMLVEAETETKGLPNVRITKTLAFGDQFDIVTCFEVLEHLTREKQQKVLEDCKMLVKPGGTIIISVPIETGVSGFVKNILRWLVGQPHTRNFSDVIKSSLSLKLQRNEHEGYIYSHIGFRYRDLENTIRSQNLTIIKRIFSPIKCLGPVANSQVFYELKSR